MFDTPLGLRCEGRPDSERFYVAVVTAKSICLEDASTLGAWTRSQRRQRPARRTPLCKLLPSFFDQRAWPKYMSSQIASSLKVSTSAPAR